MDRKFIIDKEIDLNEYDFLKTKVYADNLSKIINNAEPDKVFTIGLFGGWGTGKSSIIATSQKEFDQKKVKFVNYDAWQYSNDSFRRMFLRKLREELKFDESDDMKRFYENKSMDLNPVYKISRNRISLIVVACITLCILFALVDIDLDKKIPIYFIIAMFTGLATVLYGAFNQLKISVTKPHLFAPEQFEDCFKEMISSSLRKFQWEKITKLFYVLKNDQTVRNLDKLVIVIDNIDRCHSDLAYTLLTDIKTFLGSEDYSIVFVLPIDDEALRKHLLNIGKHSVDDKNGDREKEEFLRKFFNVTMRIKPFGETDMFSFSKDINDKFGLNFNKETVNLTSKEYSTNPRRVIQLFNNLNSELNLYEKEFSEKYETVICCILLLREEHADYYKEVIKNPSAFLEGKKVEGDNNDRVNRFVRVSRNALRNVELKTLSTILTNSDNIFSELSSDVRDAIDTFDINTIGESYKDESIKSNLLDCFVHKVKVAANNNLLDDVLEYFDIITLLNEISPVPSDINNRLNEYFRKNMNLIIEALEGHDNMCRYVLSQESQGIMTLKPIIIKFITNEANNNSSCFNSLFNAVLRNFDDTDSSKKINQIFLENCHFADSSLEYSVFQIEALFSTKFIEHITNNIKGIDISSNEYERLKFVFEKKNNISEEVFSNVFEKIVSLMGDLRGKTTDDISAFLDYVLPLLKSIPEGKLKNKIKSLIEVYNIVVNDRPIPNPNAPQQTQRDTFENFLEECADNNFKVVEIREFIVNILRVLDSANKNMIKISKSVKGFIKFDRQGVNSLMVDLVAKNFRFESLIDVLNEDENYSDLNTRLLLDHVLKLKDDNENYLLAEGSAKDKVEKMLTYAVDNNSDDVFDFLNVLSQDERYKEIIADILIERGSKFINELPQKLSKLSYKHFCKDNYNDYEDNYDYLKVIAENGTQAQTKLLVKILIEKLDEEDDVDVVLDIFENIKSVGKAVGKQFKARLEELIENVESIDGELLNRIETILEITKEIAD